MPTSKQPKSKKRKEPEPEVAKEENEAPSLREIIPDGNVILVVGPKKIKIQLSSHLLSSTSPVFAVMLGPNFKKGTLLQESQGPVEIALPEDNAEAFWKLYSVLHGAHPRTHDLEPDQIYDIAFLAHKYDLVERLTLAREAWFRETDTSTYISAKDNYNMLVAAYWLESEFGFAYVSRNLVEDAGLSIYKHAMESTDQVLGLRLSVAIEQLRLNEAKHAGVKSTGLCLRCFNNPEMEKFWIKSDHCPSSYNWVRP